ncbi:MAG: MerR family transcriptional regulator [Candidatus Anammoximicrobium sp.]|nr:MerR family transcriptional regulator [Candidatus Anammoximicrobium sp.]
MAPDAHADVPPLKGRRVAFLGKLGGVTRREAQQLVRQQGGTPVEKPAQDADLIVIGADELPLSDAEDLLGEPIRQAAAEGRIEIIGETQLWQRLGLMESESNVRRLYTPAMLADLLQVSVATIRRWHRRGLIVPAREVRRLPYFDFQEVATARRLAQLLGAGVSPAAIEKKLAELSRFVPEVERPLAQLSVIVEGRQLLLRQGEGLIEPGGQMRFDFEAFEEPPAAAKADGRGGQTLSFEQYLAEQTPPPTKEELLETAAQLEDESRLEEAAEMYRVVLTAGGPNPEVCFQLAELLYRLDDLAGARERYYMAIELDENYVEARANLGCVLAELGQSELAISAFQGALKYHRGFPDVHFHLARTLDELGRRDEAEVHWREFLDLAPDSPWAQEAENRIGGV